MYDDDNSLYEGTITCATTLTPEDAAYKFIRSQSNRSGTVRTMLNDAVKVCPELADYTKLPESKRLRDFFNYIPPENTEDVKAEMISKIDSIVADETFMSAYTTEAMFIHAWRKYADKLVPEEYRKHTIGFIVRATVDTVSTDSSEPFDINFFVHLKNFIRSCEKGDGSPYTSGVRRFNSEFVKVVFVALDAWDLYADESKKLVRYTPNYEKLVRLVLAQMRDYYENRYGRTWRSLEAECLHNLISVYGSRRSKTIEPTPVVEGA